MALSSDQERTVLSIMQFRQQTLPALCRRYEIVQDGDFMEELAAAQAMETFNLRQVVHHFAESDCDCDCEPDPDQPHHPECWVGKAKKVLEPPFEI